MAEDHKRGAAQMTRATDLPGRCITGLNRVFHLWFIGIPRCLTIPFTQSYPPPVAVRPTVLDLPVH